MELCGDLIGDVLQIRSAGNLRQKLGIQRFHQNPGVVAPVDTHDDVAP